VNKAVPGLVTYISQAENGFLEDTRTSKTR